MTQRIYLAAAAALLLLPALAQAAGGGLTEPRLDLTIWTIVIFVLLMTVLYKFAWGPMLDGLNKRESNIRLAVEEAKLAREETERTRAQFKAESDKAAAHIAEMMAEARRDGEKLKEELLAQGNSQVQAERQRLRREIETEKDKALQELWNQTAQLATLISAKAIGRSLSPDDHSRLLDEALNEIRANKA